MISPFEVAGRGARPMPRSAEPAARRDAGVRPNRLANWGTVRNVAPIRGSRRGNGERERMKSGWVARAEDNVEVQGLRPRSSPQQMRFSRDDWSEAHLSAR